LTWRSRSAPVGRVIALASETGGAGASVKHSAGIAVVAATAALAGAVANKIIADNALVFARTQLPPATTFKTATASDLVWRGTGHRPGLERLLHEAEFTWLYADRTGDRMVVMGFVIVMVWRFGVITSQRIREIETPARAGRGDDAVVGFCRSNNRLPWSRTPPGRAKRMSAAFFYGKLRWLRSDWRAPIWRMFRYGCFRATNPTQGWMPTLRLPKDRPGR